MPALNTSLVWFRRDLRDFDHVALHHALRQSNKIYCAFIFDTDILDELRDATISCDRRLAFIHAATIELDAALRAMGGALIVRHARACDEIPALAEALGVDAVFANHDYEPLAITRDALVADRLKTAGRQWFSFKDQVIFEKDEVLTLSGKPFSVFTPYKNAWLKKLYADEHTDHAFAGIAPYRIALYQDRFAQVPPTIAAPIPSLEQMGFASIDLATLLIAAGMSGGEALLNDFTSRMNRYDAMRDFPAIDGTSRLSVHLRFGTVSIRTLVQRAVDAIHLGEGGSGAAVWLSELIWRDFYFMILHHHPHVAERAFKPAFDAIEWEDGAEAQSLFDAWCNGKTGYPLVDAAMTQLNQTGFMHNRLRMVTASFLIKDLGIDWRWGERYFARQLNDFDLAANNGGWQWAASSGCDAQPYFRIFNPITQSQRFDPEGKFIRRYLPQLGKLDNKSIHAPWLASEQVLQRANVELGENYPLPIVAHEKARQQTLARYAVVKSKGR
jgi:deoxyribodipyrimidine photo-lyase